MAQFHEWTLNYVIRDCSDENAEYKLLRWLINQLPQRAFAVPVNLVINREYAVNHLKRQPELVFPSRHQPFAKKRPQPAHLFFSPELNDFIGNALFHSCHHGPGKSSQTKATRDDKRLLAHLIDCAEELPNGMPAQHIICPPTLQGDSTRTKLCRSHSSMMQKDFLGKRSCL